MRVIDPSFEIIDHSNLLSTIEAAGRTCWKSEDKICEGSAEPFIDKLKNFKHLSVLEHGIITVRIICDRGVSHELVRHRLCSFSQESSRYCAYNKDKFGKEVTFIRPSSFKNDRTVMNIWEKAMSAAESYYFEMFGKGCSAQQARSVLPNSLKTEIVVSTNPREWAHIFKLRCHKDAHPDMVATMVPIRDEFVKRWPVLFTA